MNHMMPSVMVCLRCKLLHNVQERPRHLQYVHCLRVRVEALLPVHLHHAEVSDPPRPHRLPPNQVFLLSLTLRPLYVFCLT